MKETKTKKKMHKLNELFEEKRGQHIRLQQLSIKGENICNRVEHQKHVNI